MTFAFDMESGVDEDFGRVRAYYENWAPGMAKFEFKEIPTRNCTPEDFGIDENKKTSLFYAPDKEHKDVLLWQMSALRCFD